MRLLIRLFIVALGVGLLVLNLRLYHGPAEAYQYPAQGRDVVPHLRRLGEALRRGEGATMQGLFPEGFFFSHALYGLSWVEVARREQSRSGQYHEALAEARWAWAELDSVEGRAPFSETMTPAHGVFYVGWKNWLLGGILMLQPAEARDARELATYQAELEALAAAFEASPSPFLDSYPGQAWPVDNTVAIAALSLHDQILPPRHASTVARWRQQITDQGLADALFPHRVETGTGRSLDGPRATSSSLISRMLFDIDPAWAQRYYGQFRAAFVRPFLGVPGALEYGVAPPGRAGDVDSGPLMFGFTASGTIVTLAAAQAAHDTAVADALIGATEAVSLPYSWGNRQAYAMTELTGVAPIGDLFIVWAKTTSPWSPQPAKPPWPQIVSPVWRWPFHIISLILIGLAWQVMPGRRSVSMADCNV
jgi:hypothetical protein